MEGELQNVKLYLYDISGGLAARLSPLLLGCQVDGLWHSTVVVGQAEYSFGPPLRLSFPGQGPLGPPDRVIDHGVTALPSSIRDDIVRNLASRYDTGDYHPLFNNCNSFAAELAELLTGTPAPEDISGQAGVWLASPLINDALTALRGSGLMGGPVPGPSGPFAGRWGCGGGARASGGCCPAQQAAPAAGAAPATAQRADGASTSAAAEAAAAAEYPAAATAGAPAAGEDAGAAGQGQGQGQGQEQQAPKAQADAAKDAPPPQQQQQLPPWAAWARRCGMAAGGGCGGQQQAFMRCGGPQRMWAAPSGPADPLIGLMHDIAVSLNLGWGDLARLRSMLSLLAEAAEAMGPVPADAQPGPEPAGAAAGAGVAQATAPPAPAPAGTDAAAAGAGAGAGPSTA